MNLYEKISEVLQKNGVREKDIVMAYGYAPDKTLIITPDILKKSFSDRIVEEIDFSNMKSVIVFGLDYLTQKAWMLGMFGDPSEWKFKKDLAHCGEFYVNRITMKCLRDKIDEQVQELAKSIEDNKPGALGNAISIMKGSYNKNQREYGLLKKYAYNIDNSSMYDTQMKEFSLYNNKEENNEEDK